MKIVPKMNKEKKKDKLKITQQNEKINNHRTKMRKTSKGETAKNKSINNNSNNNKIIQLLTVEPELVSGL